MEPDPHFPDRPTHPDFDRLSKALIANDDVIDHARGDRGDVYRDYVSSFADLDSLMYAANQRVMRMLTQLPPSSDRDIFATASSAWIDGFMAAARMFTTDVQDGQHR